jgi:hypothetical protein
MPVKIKDRPFKFSGPLVIFAYFCYHPTNESLHFRRLLLLGFLALYSFHQRMVEALA